MQLRSIITTGLLALASSTISAQVLVGPEAGLTFSTMEMTHNGHQYNTKYVTGGSVGATFDFYLDYKFYFQPSLSFGFLHGGTGSFISYSSVANGVPASESDERSYRTYAIQIPLMFTYKTDYVYHPNNFTFGIGPYIGINMGGNYSRTYTTTLNGFDRPVYDDHLMRIGGTPVADDLRPFEIGARAAIGYEMGIGLNIKVFYGFGFNNVAPDNGTTNNYMRSQGGGLTLSYYLNRNQLY